MADVELSPEFTLNFNKRANTSIKRLFRERLAVFKKNPYDLSLNNHPLKYNLRGYRSWSLTDDTGRDDFRVIYRPLGKGLCLFVDFGTHEQVYRSWVKENMYWFNKD